MKEFESDTGAQKLALFGFALAGTLAAVPLLQWLGSSVAAAFHVNDNDKQQHQHQHQQHQQHQDTDEKKQVDSSAVTISRQTAAGMYDEFLLQDILLLDTEPADEAQGKHWLSTRRSSLKFAGLVEKIEALADVVEEAQTSTGSLSIPLELFLDAAMELLPLFHGFQCSHMPLNMAEFLERDITKNANLAREQGAKRGAKSVQELVASEINDDKQTFQLSGSATECIMWLKRTLQFMQGLINELVIVKEPNLHAALERSYDTIYAPVHPFFLRPIVKLCFSAFPTRSRFLETLGHSEREVVEGLERVLNASSKFLYIIVFFFRNLNLSATDVHNVILSSPSQPTAAQS